ncbi:hypothetical protein [Algoriphagus winogradskyi]|uniref:Transposase n=1 Tax=Algoriphagus winogradskyi TaxID=237017 RepID=A0ABY1NYG7_9BACT|nr:hypothetical protein [Algoriphagus winogradskyi]SMP20208.1 hypothetical protein SAMN06265367_103103 [Algoriphagus winogradskyi]
MLNKILRAFTGYKIKNIAVDGFEIKISYVGKFPTTSPLAFLKELKEKISFTPRVNVDSFDFKAHWETRLAKVKHVLPSCSAKFQIDGSTYKISRYVSKEGKTPVSIYEYSENDHTFAFFSRLYDHGIFFYEIKTNLISSMEIRKSKEDSNRYFISNDHYSVILDVFGHSQVFIWNDQEAVNRCLNRVAP